MSEIQYLTETIELLPVMRFEPWDLSEHYEQHRPTADEFDPATWDIWWKACLADTGMTGIEPIHTGSWLVAISQLSNDTLLSKIPGDHETPGDNGGYVLRCGGVDYVLPQCCGDLGNIRDWEEAVKYRGSEWQMLWIGHPWVSVRFQDRSLIFSEYYEGQPPAEPGHFAVEPMQLQQAVDKAQAEVSDFFRRLKPLQPDRAWWYDLE